MQVQTHANSPPQSAPVAPQHIGSHSYIAYEYDLHEVAFRLKRHGYRGAICGPDGSGKTVMLQALGDELMAHGLTPLPLLLDEGQKKSLPTDWRRTIRKARHTDALLLDGYDRLPIWARAWVLFASRRAGAVVVTAEREMRFKTLAHPKPTKRLLEQLIEQRMPAISKDIDSDAIYDQCGGNLSEALQIARQLAFQMTDTRWNGKKQAS